MKFICAVIMLVISLSALADETSLIDQFFGKNGIPNKKNVYAGEMLKLLDQPTLGENLPASIKKEYRLISKSDKSLVYAVLLTTESASEDWYIFLVNENNAWKIEAVRKLALPVFFYEVLKELSGKVVRKAEEEAQYRNMLMVVRSDAELKEFLLNNMVKFQEIVKSASRNLAKSNKLAKNLNLNSVKFFEDTKSLEIKIGGILDNSVGYMYVPDGERPPAISPENYIYIEKVAENWFIYKTT